MSNKCALRGVGGRAPVTPLHSVIILLQSNITIFQSNRDIEDSSSMKDDSNVKKCRATKDCRAITLLYCITPLQNFSNYDLFGLRSLEC